MHIALDLIGGFLVAIATGSALGKFARNPQVLAGLAHVGVTDSFVPVLATLELLGAIGVVVGIWSRGVAVAAAAGLALYFAGAVLFHVRAKDDLKNMAPPLVLEAIALVVLWLEFRR
jgi:DoxX-like family